MAAESEAGEAEAIDPSRAADAESGLRARAKKVLPWLIAAGMIYYVFTRVPVAQAWEATRTANLGLFVAVMGTAILTWFAIESTLYAWLFTRFNAPIDRSEARALRGTLTEPGVNSPHRERTPEENLDLLERMKAGEFDEGSRVLRARIDMASPNMNLRDPILYRIRKVPHHQTGDDWVIYPTYDFAHG